MSLRVVLRLGVTRNFVRGRVVVVFGVPLLVAATRLVGVLAGGRVVLLRIAGLPGGRVVLLRVARLPGGRVVFLWVARLPGGRVVFLRVARLPGGRVVPFLGVAGFPAAASFSGGSPGFPAAASFPGGRQASRKDEVVLLVRQGFPEDGSCF